MIAAHLKLALPATLFATQALAQSAYVPPAGNWEKRTPEQVGLVKASVDSAVKIAIASESPNPKDLLANHLASSFGSEPHG